MSKLPIMKTVVLPLNCQPVCGHDYPGDLMTGTEQGCHEVIRNNVRYIASLTFGSCSICNERMKKEIEKKIEESK